MKKRIKGFEVCIWLLLVFIVIALSSVMLSYSLNFNCLSKKTILVYDYLNTIEYKVNLKDNDYYTNTSVTDEYVSSLINNIDLSFKYNLNTSKALDSKLNYKIISTLYIGSNESNLLKDEKVVDTGVVTNDTTKLDLYKDISMDYQYYTNYVNSYQKEYKLSNIDAKLVYSFITTLDSTMDSQNISEETISTVEVPISNEKTKIDSNLPIRAYKSLTETETLPLIKNITMFILAIILIITGIILIIPLFMAISMVRKQDDFNRLIKKYLVTYDDIIVESSALILIDDKEVIEVTSFKELLNAEQELHIPIVYSLKEVDKEAWFTITSNNQIWIYKLKNDKKYLK